MRRVIISRLKRTLSLYVKNVTFHQFFSNIGVSGSFKFIPVFPTQNLDMTVTQPWQRGAISCIIRLCCSVSPWGCLCWQALLPLSSHLKGFNSKKMKSVSLLFIMYLTFCFFTHFMYPILQASELFIWNKIGFLFHYGKQSVFYLLLLFFLRWPVQHR